MWQQEKLRKFCEEKSILISAYSPLGAKGTLWGTDRVMECDVLKEIAKAKGKSLAQVVYIPQTFMKVCLSLKMINKRMF